MFQAIFETYSKNYLYFLWQLFVGASPCSSWQVGGPGLFIIAATLQAALLENSSVSQCCEGQ